MGLGDTYHARFQFQTDDGRVFRPGLHVEQTALVFDATHISDEFENVWKTAYTTGIAWRLYAAGGADGIITLTDVLIRRINPLEPVETIVPVGATNAAGGSSAAPLPWQNAVLFSMRTQFIGRSYRGRMYLPGYTNEAQDDDGLLLDDVATPLAAGLTQQCADWLDALAAAGYKPVVWSKKLTSGEDIVGNRIDRRFRTIRKRESRTPVYVTP